LITNEAKKKNSKNRRVKKRQVVEDGDCLPLGFKSSQLTDYNVLMHEKKKLFLKKMNPIKLRK
jgi:hypothetical protein